MNNTKYTKLNTKTKQEAFNTRFDDNLALVGRNRGFIARLFCSHHWQWIHAEVYEVFMCFKCGKCDKNMPPRYGIVENKSRHEPTNY